MCFYSLFVKNTHKNELYVREILVYYINNARIVLLNEWKKRLFSSTQNIETAHSKFLLTKQKFQTANKTLILKLYLLALIEQ